MNILKKNKQILIWTPILSVNEDNIDQQHQQLLTQIGVLAFALRSGEADEKVAYLLKFLEKYINDHLRYEEKYMLKHQYPEYEQHRKAHQVIERKLKEFNYEFYAPNNNKIILAEKLEGFLTNWWINHISSLDIKYSKFIKNKLN